MYHYRVAFQVNGKELNAWFISSIEYKDEEAVKALFREKAKDAVGAYLREARSVPRTGSAEAYAIYPEVLPSEGPIQPLDAFDITL